MATKTILQDEGAGEYTARIYSNKAVSTMSGFNYYLVGSATATAAIATGPGVLHSITMGASAAGSKLFIYDGTTAAAIGGVDAGVIARIEGGTIQNRVLDAIFSTGLTYRLSAVALDGVIITYALAS